MPRSLRSLRNLILAAAGGVVLAAGCGADQPAATPPADTGKMEPGTGKMEGDTGKMGKMAPK